MSLTDSIIRQAMTKPKPYFLADDDGLSLKVDSNGRKSWSYRYTSQQSGKRSRAKIGNYPEMSLKKARSVRDEFKEQANALLSEKIYKEKTFKDIANEWLEFKIKKSCFDMPRAGVIELALKSLNKDIYPIIGDNIFKDLRRYDLVRVLKQIEKRNVKEPVKKTASYLNQIYDYAVSMGYCDYNIAQGLNKISHFNAVKKHYAYLSENKIAEFIFKLNQVKTHPIIKKALLFKLYTGVRGSELLLCESEHIDLKNKIWRIPARHIKQYRRKAVQGIIIPDFIVPLSSQAIEIISSALEWSYGEKYVFCSPKQINQPLHFNTLNYVIRKMGYTTQELSSHGLRSTFSTILNNSGLFQPQWIEAQLSHMDTNQTRSSYNHADYLEQRIEMMQWWADFILNQLKIDQSVNNFVAMKT